MSRFLGIVVLCAIVAATAACRDRHAPAPHEAEEVAWAVTAWGERYEIFAECEPLVQGRPAPCHTHVTVLEDFSPLRKGLVVTVLRAAGGADENFARDRPSRDGIFPTDVTPSRTGSFALLFRVEGPSGPEEIAAGQVRVGDASSAGGLVEAPDLASAPGGDGAAAAAEPIAFLKEQQWRTEFATAEVREGSVHASVKGSGRVRPAAGGEILLTAPVDGVVFGGRWPFIGLDLARGSVVFQMTPRIDPSRSLAELEATRAASAAELQTARGRLARLEELLPLEAVSCAEVDEARARVATLEARADAARQDLATATAGRSPGSEGAERVTIRAPFDGRVAEVRVTPGQAVAAGEPLGRLVKVRPLWIDVALRPADAPAVTRRPAGITLRTTGAAEAVAFDAESVRLISRSPEVDAATGTVRILIEVPGDAQRLPLGGVVDVEILTGKESRGIVIPSSATVDDGGVTIVYVQIDGESFVRREITTLARQGDLLLVDGLAAGERLVTRGGGAIRRAALLSSGPIEGHVH